MIMRIAHAVAIGFGVALICLFLGGVLLPALHVSVLTSAGNFLVDWAVPIGIVFGILDYVAGGFGPTFGTRA